MHRASHPYGRSCTQAKAEAVRWCSSANANRRPCPSTAALAPPHKYLCSMVNDTSLLLRSTAPAFCQQRHDACSFARRVVAIPYSRRPLHISASPHTHIGATQPTYACAQYAHTAQPPLPIRIEGPQVGRVLRLPGHKKAVRGIRDAHRVGS